MSTKNITPLTDIISHLSLPVHMELSEDHSTLLSELKESVHADTNHNDLFGKLSTYLDSDSANTTTEELTVNSESCECSPHWGLITGMVIAAIIITLLCIWIYYNAIHSSTSQIVQLTG